ncbi:Uncharacterised protein [Vibrio cholerae]|nr:Uncharacterised protein [Vibrio cholerae]
MAKLTNAITTTPNCKPESVMRRLKVRKSCGLTVPVSPMLVIRYLPSGIALGA